MKINIKTLMISTEMIEIRATLLMKLSHHPCNGFRACMVPSVGNIGFPESEKKSLRIRERECLRRNKLWDIGKIHKRKEVPSKEKVVGYSPINASTTAAVP